MASLGSSRGVRGRRKQAKPQRKQVELDVGTCENKTNNPNLLNDRSASSMSPDANHNELPENREDIHKRMNGIHKEATVPEKVINGNSLSLHSLQKVVKTGGTAEDVPGHFESVKAAIGELPDEDEKLQEYLQRSDTAVIYAEPVGRSENVPTLTSNFVSNDGEELGYGSEYFIKCPQCQKGFQSFQTLKEHMEMSHSNFGPTEAGSTLTPNALSPTPTSGSYGCSQCSASFTSKDQLEKHELLHSPNAQVSCKVCNKTFANVYRLQRHMISHDESAVLRKFKCTECEKAFKFKHHLKEHIRIHSGEKPFECGNCGKRFSHSGSYSSHMTSKKCLVMNLKLGRTRPTSNNSLIDKNSLQNNRTAKRSPINPLNNNITTSPNHNSYLPILPKYSEAAAAAFLQNSLTSNSGMHPFYITPSSVLSASGHAIAPYTMPSLGHLIEQLQASPHRPPHLDTSSEFSSEALRYRESLLHSPKPDHTANKSDSSICEDLVMDESCEENNSEKDVGKGYSELNGSNNDLETVKRILETVNATVTQQLLHANAQKLSSEIDSRNNSFKQSASENQNGINCNSCKKSFDNQIGYDNHECEEMDIKSEGLAAKLEDAINIASEDQQDLSCTEEDLDFDKNMHKNGEYDMDCESVTTTDQVSEDGRKVRVRSLIADEQLKILKDHYAINPRPKREELLRIAEKIGFPVRVVQVWFQNTRARDRREGRLIQVPYNPSIPIRFPSNLVPSNSQSLNQKIYPLAASPQYMFDQPLDLSTKKGTVSVYSSPASSPQRPTSAHQSDSAEEVVNLSYKSSRSPTPLNNMPHQNHYQSSSCSSDPQTSPSPVDFNSSSKLAQILAQPANKLALSSMGLVPINQLIQFSTQDIPNLSQLISSRISCLSPNSEKRSWNDSNDHSIAVQELLQDDINKRNKMSQMVLKSLSSPVGGTQDEVEGQFVCDQCDKAFAKQSSLARHKYEHSGQRPHKCDECPKAFKHKHHLTEHKRLHSGEKPFQCCKCLKRFSHSGSYSQHMNHRYSYCKPYRE